MRYLTQGNRWVSTETPSMPSSENLVDAGLLHPDMLGLSQLDLIRDGIIPSGFVRLTDGPGGEPRYASYYDVLMTNPWGYGTVHTIARGLARLPLKLYETDLAEETEPGTVQNIIHPSRARGAAGKIAWALRYPNAGGAYVNAAPSRRALWYGTVINKLVHGNAIWEILYDDFGGINGFQLHPMEYVDVDETTLIYTIRKQQFAPSIVPMPARSVDERVVTPDKIVHYGLWESGRRPLNPSPVRALHTTVALYDAVTRHMVGFFNNGARVSGHMKIEPNASPKAKEAIREEILKLYSGPSAAGKVLISSGEWQAFHREPQFQGIVDLIKFSRDEIFVTYGVPPPVMGVIERAIMANAREMRDQYVRDLIGPHAEFLSGDFEAQVIDRIDSLRARNVFAYFDVDEQLRPDLWKRASAFRNLMLAYTPNELRRIERNVALPEDGANTIWRPLNEGPLNNMPDYQKREELQEREVDIQERELEHQIEMDNKEPAPQPAPPQQQPPQPASVNGHHSQERNGNGKEG